MVSTKTLLLKHYYRRQGFLTLRVATPSGAPRQAPLEQVSRLVGACLATGVRIFATGSDSVSKIVLRSCGCYCLISRAYNHGLKGPHKPKTYCDNGSLRSYLSPSVFIVRSGPVWRQDLAILSLEGPRDNTCQLRCRAIWKVSLLGL